MSTNQIIALAIGAIIIIGGGYYLVTAKGSNDYGAASNAPDTAYSGSLKDLAARGGSYECHVDTTATNGTKGDVFVSGGNMRGDFTTTVNGSNVDSHIINVDGYTYAWSSAAVQGVKIKLNTAATAQTSPNAPSQGIDQNTSYSWNCDAWTADQSQFTPPTSITFMDMTNLQIPGGASPSYPGY